MPDAASDPRWLRHEEFERIRSLIRHLYGFSTCGAGGPLHIVLDDLNVKTTNLDFCEGELSDHWSIQEAKPSERNEIRETAKAIIDGLRPFTASQRRKVIKGV